jgi:hypothetical protein
MDSIRLIWWYTTGNVKFPDGAVIVKENKNTVKEIQNTFPDGEPSGLARQGNKQMSDGEPSGNLVFP